jgi:hypothetical protein
MAGAGARRQAVGQDRPGRSFPDRQLLPGALDPRAAPARAPPRSPQRNSIIFRIEA